jgi:hypothetical protein
MTQTATRTSAKPTAAAGPKTIEIEVGRKGQGVLNKLANLRVARLMAEREEKPVKEQARELWLEAAETLEVGDVILVKAMNVVRGRVSLKRRAAEVDLDLLLAAYPEAFEACVNTEVYSPQFDSV